MKHRDAMRIALTKLRTRKIRTTFLLLSLAIGLTMIAGLAGGVSGVMQTARVMFSDAGNGQYYVVEMLEPNGQEAAGGGQKSAELDVVAYQKEIAAKYNQPKIELQYIKVPRDDQQIQTLTGFPEPTVTSISMGFQTSGQSFVDAYIADENTVWNTPTTGPVPILVPTAIFITGDMQDWFNKSAKDQYEFLQAQQQRYLGSVVRLRSVSRSGGSQGPAGNAAPGVTEKANNFTSETEFQIVGFLPEDRYASNLYQYNSFVIPEWAPAQISEIKKLFEGGSHRAMIPFTDKKERDAFLNERLEAEATAAAAVTTGTIPLGTAGLSRNYLPAQGRFDAFTDIAAQIRNVFLGVAGVIVVIGEIMLLLTVGRVVADSRKEIGVYRAIGASRSDIRKIFFWYVSLLSICATVISLILAIIGQIIASLKWGEQLFYTLVQFSGTAATITKPAYLFLGTTIWQGLFLFVFALVSAAVAALIPIIRASRIDPIVALKEE